MYRAVLGMMSVLLAASVGAAAGDSDRICVFELKGALPNDRPMTVHLDLRGGKVRAAFAAARTFNRMPYEVDASGLKVTAESLAGPLGVTIPTDGWVPKDAAKVPCHYDLAVDLAEGKASGTFTGRYGDSKQQGAVAGTVQPRPAWPKRCRFELSFRNPSRKPRKISSVGIVFGMRDGKVIGCKLVPVGSITDIGDATLADKADITFADGRLKGTVDGWLVGRAGEKKAFTVTFDAAVIGEAVAGPVTVRLADEQSQGAGLQGTMDRGDVPSPADCCYKLTLHDGVAPGQIMNLFLSTRGGRFIGGFVTTPNFNNSTHEVDVTGLKLTGGKVSGEVKVTIFPDAWIPRDHKGRSARYTIEAKLDDAEIIGRYEGQFADAGVGGAVEGQISPKPPVGNIVAATIKPEGGLYNASPAGYRAFFTMDVADGRITGGRIWNNHDRSLKGTVDGGEIRLADEVLTATFTATVQPGTSARPGKYTIKVAGPIVGGFSCGRAESRWQDKTWTSRYWANWQTEPRRR